LCDLREESQKVNTGNKSEDLKSIGTFLFATGQSVAPPTSAMLNKAGDVRTTYHPGAFEEPLLPWKSKYNIYFECVSVASGIQDVESLRRIILSSVACLVIPYFCTLSRRRHDFRKVVLQIQSML